MAYLGNGPGEAYTNTVKDSFNGNGSTTAFTMSVPSSTNDVRVVVENVIQDPTVAYSCAGTTLTFTSAPPSGTANIYVIHLGLAVMTTVPPSEISDATVFSSNVTVQGAFTSRGIDDNADSTAITIDSSENVGIGETAPANLLHVKASDTGITPHASAQIVLEREGTNYLQFLTAETGTSGILFGDGSDVDVAQIKYDHNATAMSFVTEASERMRLDSSGNVGIGTTSITSGFKLDVVGDARFSDVAGDDGVELGWSAGSSAGFVQAYDRGASAFRDLTLNNSMTIDSSGAVTMPSQPAFSAINNTGSGQNNIAPSTYHTVVFGGEIFDQGSDFTNNTFTAPVTGRYQLNLKIRLYQLDTAATYYQSLLITSNRTYELALLSPRFTSDPEYFTFTTSILADMDASDSAYIQIYQHGGSAQTDLQYGESIFSGYLVA